MIQNQALRNRPVQHRQARADYGTTPERRSEKINLSRKVRGTLQGLPTDLRSDVTDILKDMLRQHKNWARASSTFLEATGDDRITKDRFRNTSDQSINLLMNELNEATRRCRFEFHNDPFVRGMTNDFARDVVGRRGPSIQVNSPDTVFNEEVEDLFKEASKKENFDLAGKYSLKASLKLDVKQNLWAGVGVVQRVTKKGKGGFPVKARYNHINPLRIETPWDRIGKPNMAHGFEVNDDGALLRIWARRKDQQFGLKDFKYDPIKARDAVIIQFEHDEPDQLRGWPQLIPIVETASQMRAFKRSTMTAARIASMLAVLMFAENAQTDFIEHNFIEDIEPGTQATMPPGYKPMQIKPEHPSTQYAEFQKQQLRELGRPIGMPYMRVAHDASGHNYSSGRLDLQAYQDRCWDYRDILADDKVLPFINEIVAEASLARAIRPAPQTGNVNYMRNAWEAILTWQPFPHVDPAKEALAAEIRIRTKISTETHEGMNEGRDFEEMEKVRKREREIRAKLREGEDVDDDDDPATSIEDLAAQNDDLDEELEEEARLAAGASA